MGLMTRQRWLTSVLLTALCAAGCDDSETSAPCTGADCVDAMVAMDQGVVPDADTSPAPDVGVGRVGLLPESFEFSFVDVGDTQEQTVRVSNEGSAPVLLTEFAAAFSSDYTLYWQRGGAPLPLEEQQLVFREGQSTFPDSIEIEPTESVVFTLIYAPSENGQRGGQLSFSADRDVRIPIGHSDDRPEFVFEPEVVDFETVAPGERQLKILQVTNIGSAIATLNSVAITGSPAFSITIEGQDPEVTPSALYNPDRDLEQGVGLEKYFDILVKCQPETEDAIEAEILITSDAINGELRIPVRANSATMTP